MQFIRADFGRVGRYVAGVVVGGAVIAGLAIGSIYAYRAATGGDGFNANDYLEPRIIQIEYATTNRQLDYPGADDFVDGYARIIGFTIKETDECRVMIEGNEIPLMGKVDELREKCRDRGVDITIPFQTHEDLSDFEETLLRYTHMQITRDGNNSVESYPRAISCKGALDFRVTRAEEQIEDRQVICTDARNVRFFDGTLTDVNEGVQFPPYRIVTPDTVPIQDR